MSVLNEGVKQGQGVSWIMNLWGLNGSDISFGWMSIYLQTAVPMSSSRAFQ
jgi:hypothetical protein